MLDVEFLSLERKAFKHSILYEYDTAVFKQEVILKIKKFFESRGLSMVEVDYKNFRVSSKSVSLFGKSLIYIDLNKLIIEVSSWKKELVLLLQGITEKTFENRFLITYRVGDKFEDPDSYKSLIKECYYIVEPELNKTSIDKIIKYLIEKNKNIFNYITLKNQGIFLNSIKRCLENSNYNLVSFSKFFERVILLCIEDNIFSPSLFNDIFKKENPKLYYILYELMYNFLIDSSEGTRKKLYIFVCDLYLQEKYSVSLILSRLRKIIKEFSFLNKNLNGLDEYVGTLSEYQKYMLKKYNSIPIKDLFNFSILYIRLEHDLYRGDFLYKVDKFLRLYEKGRICNP